MLTACGLAAAISLSAGIPVFADELDSAYGSGVVDADVLNVRSGASTDTEIIGTLTEGTIVDLYDYADGWYTISFDGETAYISGDFVDVSDQESETDSEEEGADHEEDTYVYDATDEEIKLLASIIYCEAGGEVYEGKVAVGAVVLNRVASSIWPDTISDVIYQSGQFTPAMTGWLATVLAGDVNEECYEAAEAALAGEDPTGGCLSFHAGSGGTVTIGNQTFY